MTLRFLSIAVWQFLVLNDQRRAFSDEYVNLILTVGNEFIEISARNPIAALPSVTPQELKNILCILVSSKEQRETEREYYQGVIGFQSDFLYAENLEEARLMVISGQGFMPVEGAGQLPMRNGEVDTEEFSRMVDAFLENGFNYFDTAHGYLGGKSETALKGCLTSRYPCDRYILTNKLTNFFFKKQEVIRPFFEDQLKACGVEYFESCVIHGITENPLSPQQSWGERSKQ